MNKEKLFAYLEKQKPSEVMKLLDDCFSCMKSSDIRNVFGNLEGKFLAELKSDGEVVLENVRKFMEDSLNGVYYAHFDINSKNYMGVPEETDFMVSVATSSNKLSRSRCCSSKNAFRSSILSNAVLSPCIRSICVDVDIFK